MSISNFPQNHDNAKKNEEEKNYLNITEKNKKRKKEVKKHGASKG